VSQRDAFHAKRLTIASTSPERLLECSFSGAGGVSDVRDLEAIWRAHAGALYAGLPCLVDCVLDRAHHHGELANQIVLSRQGRSGGIPLNAAWSLFPKRKAQAEWNNCLCEWKTGKRGQRACERALRWGQMGSQDSERPRARPS